MWTKVIFMGDADQGPTDKLFLEYVSPLIILVAGAAKI